MNGGGGDVEYTQSPEQRQIFQATLPLFEGLSQYGLQRYFGGAPNMGSPSMQGVYTGMPMYQIPGYYPQQGGGQPIGYGGNIGGPYGGQQQMPGQLGPDAFMNNQMAQGQPRGKMDDPINPNAVPLIGATAGGGFGAIAKGLAGGGTPQPLPGGGTWVPPPAGSTKQGTGLNMGGQPGSSPGLGNLVPDPSGSGYQLPGGGTWVPPPAGQTQQGTGLNMGGLSMPMNSGQQQPGAGFQPGWQIPNRNIGGYNVPGMNVPGYNTADPTGAMPTSQWYNSLAPEVKAGLYAPYEEAGKNMLQMMGSRGQLGTTRGGGAYSGAAGAALGELAGEAAKNVGLNAWQMTSPAAMTNLNALNARNQNVWGANVGANQAFMQNQMQRNRDVWGAQTDAGSDAWRGELARNMGVWGEQLNQNKLGYQLAGQERLGDYNTSMDVWNRPMQTMGMMGMGMPQGYVQGGGGGLGGMFGGGLMGGMAGGSMFGPWGALGGGILGGLSGLFS